MKHLGVILTVVAFAFSLSASAVFAQPCEGDFDCDQDVDGSDAAVFKEDFGRSPFQDPCPACTPCPYGMIDCGSKCVDPLTDEDFCGVDSACLGGTVCGASERCIAGICEYVGGCSYPATVPKTGQTTTYATGDDGDLGKGVTWPNPRFTDNSDGTVTDNLTGLIWLKNADCFGTRTWNNALSDSNGLENGECGLTDGSSAGDWRLPNRNELASLVVPNPYYGPAVPNTAGTGQWSEGDPFTSVKSHYYWSSTSAADLPYYITWAVNMGNGAVYARDKPNDRYTYVWPVRDAQ